MHSQDYSNDSQHDADANDNSNDDTAFPPLGGQAQDLLPTKEEAAQSPAEFPAFSSNLDAALHWYDFGFQVIPLVPGEKRTALKWDPWLDGLTREKIEQYWHEHPDHDVGHIVSDGLLVLDADSDKAKRPLGVFEKHCGVEPRLIVETSRGVHHYFAVKPGVFVKTDSHDSKAHPSRLDVKAKRSLVNAAHLLDAHNISVRYNVISKRSDISIPGHKGTVDNFDNTAMIEIQSLATLNGLNPSQVPAIVQALADRNAYNPVRDWIGSNAWDGEDRLPDLYATVEAQKDYPVAFKETLLRKWLLSATAAALMERGFRSRGVLTLTGLREGTFMQNFSGIME